MICSSGIGFDPIVDDERLTFGFHGIWQGTALLYDHQTESLWYHLSGRCIEGEHRGKVLKRIESGRHTTWKEWTRTHPDTDVIAPQKKYVGRQGDQGYFSRDGSSSGSGYLPTTFDDTIQTRDDRLIINELLYGVVVEGKPRAYPLSDLRAQRVIEETVEGVPVTVWFKTDGRTAAAFDRRVKGKALSFTPTSDGRMKDTQTGSVWNFEGLCEAGAHQGQRLRALHGLLSEWYGWYAHYPQTSIHGR